MDKIGVGLPTHFASPEREPYDVVVKLSEQLKKESLLSWFDTVPMGMAIINEDRQILHCNDKFRRLALKKGADEVLGLRPGEALDCVHSKDMEAGCGCSHFCDVCGAANAIVKSLDGESDCQECRLLRIINDVEVPLDLQVFTQPMEYMGHSLVISFAMDISHEMRLRYLNRTFYHGLINGVGGMATLTEIIEAEPEDSSLFPLLIDSSKRTLRDVLYHRDIEAAEGDRLKPVITSFEAGPYFEKLILEECNFLNTQHTCADVTISGDTLTTDKKILAHVIRNMLSNALDSRRENAGQIALDCTTHDDGRASITMTNPGIIPDNIQKQMFKRYISTKSRDRGLGTYVIKLFVEKYLGGTVSFSSGHGKTSFTVTLPSPE